MVVIHPRHERADNEVGSLEALVRWGRHVHPAGDRLEVLDVEDVGVQESVPAHDVQRMELELVGCNLIPRLDSDLILSAVGERLEPLWAPDITLRERRMLQ